MWTFFQSSSLPPSERQDAWNGAVEQSCGRFITHFGLAATEFNGEIDTRYVGGLECVRVTLNAVGVRRTRKEVALNDSDIYNLVLQLRGRSLMSQGSSEARLVPGEMTLIDAAQPAAFRFSRDNVQMALHLPRALVDERRRYRQLPLAATFRGGATAITASFLQAAFENADDCKPAQSAGVRDALLSLIFSNVLGDAPCEQTAEAGGRQLLPVVQQYVVAHLSDPALSPASIAQAHGISVRHLHRLFAATETTVGHWVRQQRLQRCADDLRNSELQIINLTDIAHQWGFSDSAHFSRAFKGQFGQTPSHYRLQYS